MQTKKSFAKLSDESTAKLMQDEKRIETKNYGIIRKKSPNRIHDFFVRASLLDRYSF